MNNDERFKIANTHICKFERPQEGVIKPLLYMYPTRWCVIDKQENVAIDIKLGVKYKYIPTCSGLYVLSDVSNLILEDKRGAILDYADLLWDADLKNKAKIIIEQIKNNYQFIDGNDLYNDEEYFNYLNKEKEQEEQEQSKKQKTLYKRRIFTKKV